MSLKNNFYGAVLKIGAAVDSKGMCSFAFGNADMEANSGALKVAAEHKSYEAIGVMLGSSSEVVVGAGTKSFVTGGDITRVNELAETDEKLANIIKGYNSENCPANIRSPKLVAYI